MSLVTAEQQTRIAEAIAEVERHTDAELVTVIAAASDDYRYIPLLWAALAALVVPAVLYFTPLYVLDALYLFWAQAGVFVILALALSLSSLRVRLIPRAVREWRASNMACRQFLEQGLHHTEGETGVLIFVSEAEHFVEILVDRGISALVEDDAWREIVADFIGEVRAGRVEAGLTHAIERCGEILARTVPKTEGNTNELDNRLILIGYE
ncbi:MAG: hypothetical protein F4Y01_02645 [Gammaproteobacteria bacterium]|nr:hypothetical protein [Gammaproteobacteria bacterium]